MEDFIIRTLAFFGAYLIGVGIAYKLGWIKFK